MKKADLSNFCSTLVDCMNSNVFVVYDRNVEQYAMQVAEGRPAFGIVADEDHKTIETVMEICRWLLSQGAGRDAVLYAVGGGVTTDMVGFAAGIYKRGIRYINYPTTLLAMVDAGIGGKTGVNLDGYKNMLGVFKLPLRTVIRPEYLSTLPEREFRSGAAEVLKTFIIENEDGNYEKAVKAFSGPMDAAALKPLIEAAALVKHKIVEKDTFESSLRMVLNLGHTYGHAIEWWQHQAPGRTQYAHGEAVAIGMVQAARISEREKFCKPGLAEKLVADFQACGLPTALPCPEEELLPAVAKDKKASGDAIKFIVIKKIGKVAVYDLHLHTE